MEHEEAPRQFPFVRIDDTTELRVLGSLMEKEMSTPAYYPMTLNAITAACNQKNNRDPVVEYDEHAIEAAVERLREKSIISCVTGTGYRVQKYKHNASHVYSLSHPEAAILCLLLLRGPQTPGEIRSRSTSLHPFEDLLQVDTVIQGMQERMQPLVVKLPRRTGQKEARFMHLLSGDAFPEEEQPNIVEPANETMVEERLTKLETSTLEMQKEIRELHRRLAEFTKQFE